MSSHLSAELMNGYARRSLAAFELLDADDHLEACGVCRERISDDAGLREAVRSLQEVLQPPQEPEAAHLSYDQLEASAEGLLSRADKEILETHLGSCDLCAAEARDFASFVRLARVAIGAEVGSQAAGAERRTAEPRPPAEPKSPAEPRPKTDARPKAEPVRAAPRPAASQPDPTSLIQEAIRSATPEPAGEAEPAPEPARRWAGPALLITLSAGIVVAVAAAWLVPAMLRRQVEDLNAQVDALTKANQVLSVQAEQAESLRAEVEKVRAEAAEEAGAREPAVPAAEGSTAVTLIDRRGPVGLDANGDLIGLDGLSVGAGRTIAAALRSGQAGTPAELQDLAQVPAAPGEEASSGAVARPVSPVATIVRDPRPTFSWQTEPGAAGYTVAVYDESLNPIARSEALSRASWRPSRPLKRGAVYSWRAIVRRGQEEGASADLPSSAARFQVLGTTESATLEGLLRDAGGSHLAAGVFLARAGCVVDARREFEELLRKNPDSPLVRALLLSLEAGGRGAEANGPEPAR